ncbi:MAG: hypothetical protein A3F94_00315 [Candidatus Spechtbacteria bacterium RIFCSPLOWO2_12_FULL_38_22]|uniref:DUF58 domain-containing protein n=1 Tax=Candidatus Spechtbacteria bacterium RIFCSPLOWO2_12_FULL_38_22 TaxID=1802165 RepID=A0A1G2HH28_9BACT|nr:MAG: hypothetical protein A2728_03005 [Candidatus Spechtbacteria bacterium RIFCSPHIGHO2_01_FULL_38_11]OGZ58962.1 MAG: hypothetical protein A3E58_01320 [Candidatus Spechtbacteria bacterium RIFCSPHIGHO2_12_FULL_38_30]OGZ60693.1 MAG: hypothetical protein A3A00_02060 [Candidatus Spechtbacteria bacterium RIFCSPLOWO2_01_FULL_38_20]OGZ61570.1 MAG: hypothetical protein A3F94_00315 [Candidatus Spechtbacteria bacterium RIFCSPLOWO2_12_FULL_38_22]
MSISKDELEALRIEARNFGIDLSQVPIVGGSYFGDWDSIFSGRGMEMTEIREFKPGDSIENIDPILSAKKRKPMVVDRVETRELRALVVYDFSRSMFLRDKIRSSFAAASIVVFSTLNQSIATGLWGLAGNYEIVQQLGVGSDQYRRAISLMEDVICDFKKSRTKRLSLSYWQEALPIGSFIFIISDFLGDDSFFTRLLDSYFQDYIVVPIVVQDELEYTFPDIAQRGRELVFTDVSTGAHSGISLGRKNIGRIRAEHEERFSRLRARLESKALRFAHVSEFDFSKIRKELQGVLSKPYVR